MGGTVAAGLALSTRTAVTVGAAPGETVARPEMAGAVGCSVGPLSTCGVTVLATASATLILRAIRLLLPAMSPSICARLPMDGVPWITVAVSR